MCWIDKQSQSTIFLDNRSISYQLRDKSSKGGYRYFVIRPTVQASYTALPFRDNTFYLVLFDPPHLAANGRNGWMAKKYGHLQDNWKSGLAAGFRECLRVLRPGGTLVFKWSEHDVPLSTVVALAAPQQPLFGHKSGKNARTHWLVFMKNLSGLDRS